ncbi:DUF4190 domain-containing protein [Agromyces laixinhei]|uniref:DUF4190 domain-containing protein n=1 Tax=Agromyces laixinhei TaxID=2585717 RepID=UPI0012ED7DD6|nr:DUF4190 domain-containing protein [Agromyces laixinhei]
MTDTNLPQPLASQPPAPQPPAAQQPASQPPAPVATAAEYAAAPAAPVVPGKGLGIAGLILAIFLPLIGLIVSIIAKSKSKKAGVKNTPATAGIIVGAILTVVGVTVMIVIIAVSASLVGGLAEVCSELGTGVWEVDGVTYTCG